MTHAAGWYPDGTGRHAQRYFDGRAWTDHVADAAGRQSMDPVVPPPTANAGTGRPAAASYAGWQPASIATSFDPPALPSTLTAPRHVARSSSGAATLTTGAIVAAAGAVLALLSLFALDFWKAGSIGISLGDVADAPDEAGVGGVAAAYAGFGRFLALLVIAAVIVAVLRLPALAAMNGHLPVIATAAAGLFALWHAVALFVAPEGVGTAVTGLLGVVGFAALAAAPFLRRPVANLTR